MSHPRRIRHRVGPVIADHALWNAGDRVAVAVSGGLDSMCLLSVLLETQRWHGGHLQVATVDHGTRPGSADDADFVRDVAQSWGVPFTVVSLGLGPGVSEATMREARYGALHSLDTDVVAVAHHADDQAETLVLQAIRGAGLAGLGGMAWRRGRIVRPLLGERRSALMAWVEHHDVPFREDPTNLDRRHLRNRIRHDVMPLIEAARPGAIGALARSAHHAAADDALIEGLLDDALNQLPGDDLPASWVATQPEPLVRRALLRRWPQLRAPQITAVIRAARAGRGRVETAGGSVIEIGGGGPGSGSVVRQG